MMLSLDGVDELFRLLDRKAVRKNGMVSDYCINRKS